MLFVNDNGVFALWRTDPAASFPRPCRSAISARMAPEAGTGGRSDILWRNDTGTVVEWLMNGAQVLSLQTLSKSRGAGTATGHHFDFGVSAARIGMRARLMGLLYARFSKLSSSRLNSDLPLLLHCSSLRKYARITQMSQSAILWKTQEPAQQTSHCEL